MDTHSFTYDPDLVHFDIWMGRYFVDNADKGRDLYKKANIDKHLRLK